MIKGSIQLEDITIVNIYVFNIGASKYIKQILTYIKGEIDNNTVVGNFNTLLISMNMSSRQKIKKTLALNNTLDQMELTDRCRTFHPKTHSFQGHMEYSPGSDHILPHVGLQRKSQ